MKQFIKIKVAQMYIPHEGWFGDKKYAIINVSQITSIYPSSKMYCNIRLKDGTIYRPIPDIKLNDLYKEIIEL